MNAVAGFSRESTKRSLCSQTMFYNNHCFRESYLRFSLLRGFIWLTLIGVSLFYQPISLVQYFVFSTLCFFKTALFSFCCHFSSIVLHLAGIVLLQCNTIASSAHLFLWYDHSISCLKIVHVRKTRSNNNLILLYIKMTFAPSFKISRPL